VGGSVGGKTRHGPAGWYEWSCGFVVTTKDTGMEKKRTHKMDYGILERIGQLGNWAILWDIDWKRDI
jgi:hypothetical protein